MIGRLVRRLVGACRRSRTVRVEGRVASPGACAERVGGEAEWTLRVTLVDARFGAGRLGEPLHIHHRCDDRSLRTLLDALGAGARVTADVRLVEGAGMRARLGRLLRVEAAPPADGA